VLAALAGLLIAVSSGEEAEGEKITRGTVGGGGNLGYSFSNPEGSGKAVDGDEPPVEDFPADSINTGKSSGGGKGTRRSKGTRNKQSSTTAGKVEDPFDEVQLGGGDEGPTGPLDGDDLMQVYRKNQIAIKMCLERALKRDPLLRVPKTWVSITVQPTGSVSKVEIPSLSGTPLGKCLTSRIGRWKFRKSTEIFSSRFPVVFDS
jgi:hypothetical protein